MHDHDDEPTAAAPIGPPGSTTTGQRPRSGEPRPPARADVARRRRACWACSAPSATRACPPLLDEERSPVHDVINSGGGSRSTPRSAPTWRPGWATTSATSGCTTTPPPHESAAGGERPRLHRRVRTSCSSATRYDPSSDGRPDHARPRADARRPAAQRPGRRHGCARRHPGERPVGPLRAGGRGQRRTGHGNPRPGTALSHRRRRPLPSPPSSARKSEEREEPTAQGTFVQRQEAEEEETEE